MRPLLQHASRSLSAHAAWAAPAPASSRSFGTLIKSQLDIPSICLSCQLRRAAPPFPLPRVYRGQLSFDTLSDRLSRRQFSNTQSSLEAEKKPSQTPKAPAEPSTTPPIIQIPPPEPIEVPKKEEATPRKEEPVDSIKRVPDEDLPSHREGQRWDFSKRISDLMDDLLPKLAVVTQKVNTYTGTDYSGIAALRQEIKEQEQLVKTRRLAIDAAKQALDAAHAQQGSSQKEVVALLERKHSWSAADLERYMALIRSEHVNDQAVREAKEAVASAESALEEARSQLEKRERAQYHEEQIWSDTIRRNSTWITFVLMGVNIFLLLANVVVIEPWRRRRMVREIKTALDAQKAAMEAAVPVPVVPALAPSVPATAPTYTSTNTAAIETEIDQVIEPAGVSLEDIEKTPMPTPDDKKQEATTPETILDPVPDPAAPGAAPLTPEGAEASPQESINIEEEVAASSMSPFQAKLASFQAHTVAIAQDVVSERIISMRRIDFTTAVLQGAAAGAVITAAAIAMFLRID